jgi:hypothetical protein
VTVRRYEARVDPTILIPTREEMEPLFSALFDDLDEATTMDLVGHELEERFDAVLRQRGMVFETLAQNKVSTVRMRTQLRPAPSRGEVQGVQRWRACVHTPSRVAPTHGAPPAAPARQLRSLRLTCDSHKKPGR